MNNNIDEYSRSMNSVNHGVGVCVCMCVHILYTHTHTHIYSDRREKNETDIEKNVERITFVNLHREWKSR